MCTTIVVLVFRYKVHNLPLLVTQEDLNEGQKALQEQIRTASVNFLDLVNSILDLGTHVCTYNCIGSWLSCHIVRLRVCVPNV